MSLEGDYMLKKSWYVNFGFLFNNHGLHKPVTNWNTINLKLSPENLMPTKWNMIVTTAKEFTPLLSANMSVLYAVGTNLLILLPSFQYNMATNLDVNLVWQSFFIEMNNGFEAVNHRCFLRMKWSFQGCTIANLLDKIVHCFVVLMIISNPCRMATLV